MMWFVGGLGAAAGPADPVITVEMMLVGRAGGAVGVHRCRGRDSAAAAADPVEAAAGAARDTLRLHVRRRDGR